MLFRSEDAKAQRYLLVGGLGRLEVGVFGLPGKVRPLKKYPLAEDAKAQRYLLVGGLGRLEVGVLGCLGVDECIRFSGSSIFRLSGLDATVRFE